MLKKNGSKIPLRTQADLLGISYSSLYYAPLPPSVREQAIKRRIAVRPTIKYEEVYWHEYASPKEAYRQLADYIHFYNFERPHQALDYLTPQHMRHTPPG